MSKDFNTTGEGVDNILGIPEILPQAAPEATRQLRKGKSPTMEPHQAPREELPELELPKELVEVLRTIAKIIDRISVWERNVQELKKELDGLRASGKIKFLPTDIYTSLGPTPFLLDKLIILATRLKSNHYELPAHELDLFLGSEKGVGQLEVLRAEISARDEELAKLRLAAEVSREDILGDLKRGSSLPKRMELVGGLLSDFKAITSQPILELLAVCIKLEKRIL